MCIRDRGGDGGWLDAHLAGAFVSHKGDKLLDKLAENWAGSVYRAQQGQLVGDERMIHDVEFHESNLGTCGEGLVALGSLSGGVRPSILAGKDRRG